MIGGTLIVFRIITLAISAINEAVEDTAHGQHKKQLIIYIAAGIILAIAPSIIQQIWQFFKNLV